MAGVQRVVTASFPLDSDTQCPPKRPNAEVWSSVGGVIKRQQDLEGTDLRSGLIHRRLCDDCVRPYGEVVELGSRSGIHAL